MQKSTMWLGIFMGTLMVIAAVGCLTFASSATNSDNVYASESEVDLEELAKAYKTHVKSSSKDLVGFEERINKKDIYSGKGHVTVTMDKKGAVLGFVDDNGEAGYQPNDTQVFGIEADQEKKQIVTRDRYNRHYGLRATDVFGLYFMSRMLGGQRSYYNGGYYRSPSSARWVNSGYHKRLRSSSSFGSRSKSSRTGSMGSRRGSSGGFGSGK